MFGRRGYQRSRMRESAHGVIRVLCDVVVVQAGNNDCLAVSREAAIVGEVLTLDRNVHNDTPMLRVRVAESQPVIVNGSVRHRMRLEPLFGGPHG